MTIRVGTRGSALALAQAGGVADALRRASGSEVELVPLVSEGDVRTESLSLIGGRGVFAATLRVALLEDRCDVVVHSLKDLPTAPVEGLALVAVPVREDARDVLCSRDGRGLGDLPEGARVGTGSPRRIAQLRAARADLDVVDLRGNVDTRLRHVESGRLDAVVLAAAGLGRLGRETEIAEVLPLEEWPTAPGQGALALEVRVEDALGTDLARAARALADADAENGAAAEREVLRGLGAGCTAPVAASSRIEDGVLSLWAAVYRPDGSAAVRGAVTQPLDSGTAAMDAGLRLVEQLFSAGAAELAPLGAGA
ncbi:hydroxymethylbilane synthase [Naasia sp. SYSU D00948]|uniref:hydroxymethylbilane synthase n=1 Tax=Naasia sp. SYSU D00948 TaxID=2817379 RepID=UPI001B3030DB|nr:hydroxymethylbilane synthase [Naasia sp. SYSU D00948]